LDLKNKNRRSDSSRRLKCSLYGSIQLNLSEFTEFLLNLKSKILEFVSGNTSTSFDELAIELFDYQSKNNVLYAKFLKLLKCNPETIKRIDDIPLLPITLFKQYEIRTGKWKEETVFRSSGTSHSIKSSHYVKDLDYYNKISKALFENEYPDKNYEILALLPSYIENGESSLVQMVSNLLNHYNEDLDVFYLYDFEKLNNQIQKILNRTEKNIILIGVSFALLDFCKEYKNDNERVTVIFTGGMKNRREELNYEEVYLGIKTGFPLSSVDSEYGMTEMLSQSYCRNNEKGIFSPGRSLKILCKELYDPRCNAATSKTGQIGFIDLANIDTLSFVLTDDLGVSFSNNEFKVLGRIQSSDLRGCNLLYQS